MFVSCSLCPYSTPCSIVCCFCLTKMLLHHTGLSLYLRRQKAWIETTGLLILKWETPFFFSAGVVADWTQQRLTLITFSIFFSTRTHILTVRLTPTLSFSSPINWHFFPMLLTCFPHLIFTVSQQFKDVHLQLASGWAVTAPVDAVFCQRNGQTLPSAALHRVIKDGSWEVGKGKEQWVEREREKKTNKK